MRCSCMTSEGFRFGFGILFYFWRVEKVTIGAGAKTSWTFRSSLLTLTLTPLSTRLSTLEIVHRAKTQRAGQPLLSRHLGTNAHTSPSSSNQSNLDSRTRSFGLRSQILGLWSLVFGLRYLVLGIWYLVFGFCGICTY